MHVARTKGEDSPVRRSESGLECGRGEPTGVGEKKAEQRGFEFGKLEIGTFDSHDWPTVEQVPVRQGINVDSTVLEEVSRRL